MKKIYMGNDAKEPVLGVTISAMTPIFKRINTISLWEEIKEGYEFILNKKRVIIIVIVIGIAHLFVGSLTVSLPFMAKQLKGSSIQNLGNMEMMLGLGMLIGSIYCNYTAGRSIKDEYLFLYLSIMGLCFLGIGTLNSLSILSVIPYMLFMLFIGAVIASASILWQSLLQIHTPDDLRGRVFSISTIIGNVTLPLSYVFFGVLLKYIEIKRVLIVSGLCLIMFCIWRLCVRQVPGLSGNKGNASFK